MYEVNAVDSFCNMKLADTSGNGEKKLYLSPGDSLDFAQTYLGINIANGSNSYNYNDEERERTLGYIGFVKKSNLTDVFKRSQAEYSRNDTYRTNLRQQRASNQNILNRMGEKAFFRIDCSISQGRIYIGSQDKEWLLIPAFCIPRKTKIQIINLNNAKQLEFRIIY